MTINYIPRGVCSRQMQIEIDGDTVIDVKTIGGCNGNSKGIAALVRGMKIDEVIARLDGITCGTRSSSCPDQLAQALKNYKRTNEK